MTNKKKVVEKKVKKEEIVAPPPGAGFGEIERPKKNTASMESKSDKLDKSSNVNPEIIEAPSIDEGFDQNDVLNVDPVKAQKTLRRQFLATFILGSLVIAFDLSGMVGLEPEYNIGFTLLLMGLFWLAGNKYLRNPLVRSVFADSMYYLGFLFTFVALAVSLMGLDTLIDPDVKESRDNFKLIVAQMGPALTTTVAGMAFRIYFTQFDAITTEPQEETLQALGELSSNLIPALEKLREITVANQKVIEDHRRNVEKQINAFAQSVNRLNFKDAQKEIENLTDTIEKVSRSTERLGRAEEVISSNLQRTTNNLDNLSSEAVKVSEKIDKVDDINDEIKTLNSRIDDTNKNIDAVLVDVETKMEGAGKNINSVMDRVEKKISEVDNNISSSVEKVEKNIQVAAREINLSSNLIAKDLQKVEEETKTLNLRVKSAVSDVIAFFNRQK